MVAMQNCGNSEDDIITLQSGLTDSFVDQMSRLYQIGSAFGAVGAMMVMVTGIMFRDTMLYNKIYMKLLLCVSFCDLMVAITGGFGFDDISCGMCYVQAVCVYLFNRASWMFTTFMTITLFTHVTFGKVSGAPPPPFPAWCSV